MPTPLTDEIHPLMATCPVARTRSIQRRDLLHRELLAAAHIARDVDAPFGPDCLAQPLNGTVSSIHGLPRRGIFSETQVVGLGLLLGTRERTLRPIEAKFA